MTTPQVVENRGAFTSTDDMDPISGLPYHTYVPAPGAMLGLAPCRICGFDASSTVHNEPPFQAAEPESTAEMIDSSMIASEEAKKKMPKGKHRFIHPRDLVHSTGWFGGYPVPCAACGKPASDPDHDGDDDSNDPGDTGDASTTSTGMQQTSKQVFLPTIWTQAAQVNGLLTQQAAGSGTMVALFPKKADANKIALQGDSAEDPKDLHVTMAFLPDFNESDLPDLHHAVAQMAASTPPIDARISGKGHFNPMQSSDGKPVTYASIDSPGLAQHHVHLVNRLQSRGLNVADNHGFTPHMTLAYDKRDDEVPERHVTFDHMTVAHGADRKHFPLAGLPPLDKGVNEAAFIQLRERAPEPEELAVSAPAERAFFTEVNGKTLLTAPAYMVPDAFQRAKSPNNFMKYMAGRFVGGEQANRNGAFWSTGDLEFGLPTVAHGPLNWLHEGRHIIGSIVAADLVKPSTEQAADGLLPHIQAMSAMYGWIYPDEVAVVQQASDQSKLFYSMECVSNEVACMGQGGCGTQVPYLDYIRSSAGTCQHMRQRAGSTRQFIEPTFLGGACIVPPVRPGWADAHATVVKAAAAEAERAFEDAGRPDISASDWELLMSQVLTYAGVE